MFHLIPKPLHRLMLRIAYRVRDRFRRVAKPRLHGVSVICFDPSGHVLLVRHSYGSGQWALPGGGCRHGEDPAAAARREMQEELGLDLANLEKIATSEERVSGAPHTAHVFAATLLAAPVPDGREIIAARFFAFGALPPGLGALTQARLKMWRDHATGGAD